MPSITRSRHLRLAGSATWLLCLALAALAGLAAPPRAARVAAAPADARPAATACGDSWDLVFNRQLGGLNDIAAISPTNIWAVGYHTLTSANHQPLVLHSDGNIWSRVALPTFEPGGELFAIEAVSASDIWAVGTVGDSFSPSGSQTLTLHWNGTSWTRVASPNGGPQGFNTLYGVDALAANNIWAVGNDGGAPLLLRWNGAQWIKIAPPALDDSAPLIFDVAAITPNDVWAVGYYALGTAKPLTLHWNGAAWAQVPSAPEGQLLAVSAAGSQEVWAVGIGPLYHPLALRWSGSQWQAADLGELAATDATLYGVSVLAPNDIWLAGNGTYKPYAYHWDGAAWHNTTPSEPASALRLRGITAFSNRRAWLVAQDIATVWQFAPTVGISGAASSRLGGTGTARVTVALSATVPQTVTVNYSTADKSALAGLDYTATNGTLTIPACARSAAFSIPLLDNPAWKPAALLTATLSGPQGAALSIPASADIDIADRAKAPTGRVVYLPNAMRQIPVGRIAYVNVSNTNNWDIWLMNADGTGRRPLAESPAFDQEPAWSPDGERVAFSSNRDGNLEIYVVNADGSQLTRLTNRATNDTHPTWSADGQQIVFASQRTLRGGSQQDVLYIMNADGGGQRQLSDPPQSASDGDSAPAWSPDGAWIAYTALRAGHSQVYLIKPDGSQAHPATPPDFARTAPVWTPDSQRIAFYTGPDLALRITSVRLDGTDARIVNPNFDHGGAFAWSPDGARVAIATLSGIALLDVVGGAPVQISPPSAHDTQPAWTPR